jgi:hypothetical protein
VIADQRRILEEAGYLLAALAENFEVKNAE